MKDQISIDEKKQRSWWRITAVSCVFIAVASWVLNMGWIRLALTFLLFPLIHAIVFLWIHLKAAKISSERNWNLIRLFSCVGYVLSHLMFPDGGDDGKLFFMFGLLDCEGFFSIVLYAAILFFVIHMVATVWMLVVMRKHRKKQRVQ